MRDDVEAPFCKVANLVLGLADHNLDDRALYPLDLTAEGFDFIGQTLPHVKVGGSSQLRFSNRDAHIYLIELRLPMRLNALEHPRAGDLVDAHEHRLAALPSRRAVLDKVRGQLV